MTERKGCKAVKTEMNICKMNSTKSSLPKQFLFRLAQALGAWAPSLNSAKVFGSFLVLRIVLPPNNVKQEIQKTIIPTPRTIANQQWFPQHQETIKFFRSRVFKVVIFYGDGEGEGF